MNYLRDVRIKQGFGITELSRKTGVSVNQLRNIENDASVPHLHTIYEILRVLGVHGSEIFPDIIKPKSEKSDGWKSSSETSIEDIVSDVKSVRRRVQG